MLAVIGGFVLSFGMFVAGIVFTLFVIIGETSPEQTASADVTEVWSSEPRAVNVEAQDFERVAAVAPSDAAKPAGAKAVQLEAAAGAEPAVDGMTTAALPAVEAETPEDRAAARLLTAHNDWCQRRYRSFDPASNSYSPYAGGRAECMSPYYAQYAAMSGEPAPSGNQRFVPVKEERASEERFPMEEAQPADYVMGETALVVDDRHAQDCFARYRSYNPEDNTYQPFGGGPRLQCE